jgi:ribulose 1,5-bisphosphate synthetase/thiazole synthase
VGSSEERLVSRQPGRRRSAEVKRTIGEPARNIDVFGEVDVVVLGGGPAGIT